MNNNNVIIKNWKKKALKCVLVRTLDKNTMDWISVCDLHSLKALYPFSYTIYLSCLIIKARLMKYFFYFFAKKSPFEYASHVHSFEILKHTFKYKIKYWWVIPLQPISDNFQRFSLKIRSLEVCSHRPVNRARNDTYFAKSERRYFWFFLSSTPGTELLQTIPHPRTQRAGPVPGVARGGWPSQTEQAWITIRTLGKRLISTFLPFSLELLVKWQFYSREVNAATTILIGT